MITRRPAAASLATAAFLLACSAAATAAPVRSLPTCAVTDTTPVALDCAGFVSGNTSLAAARTMIAAEGWTGFGSLTQYKDDSVAFGSAISDTLLFDAVQTDALDESFGRVTFMQALDGPFVLALKGGNQWAGYLFGGSWGIGSSIAFDLPGRQGIGLSHVALYTSSVPYIPPAPPTTPPISTPPTFSPPTFNPPTAVPPGTTPPNAVPEPATWALALAALGGLAGRRLSVARRRD